MMKLEKTGHFFFHFYPDDFTLVNTEKIDKEMGTIGFRKITLVLRKGYCCGNISKVASFWHFLGKCLLPQQLKTKCNADS